MIKEPFYKKGKLENSLNSLQIQMGHLTYFLLTCNFCATGHLLIFQYVLETGQRMLTFKACEHIQESDYQTSLLCLIENFYRKY